MSLNDQEHLLNQLDGFPLLPCGAGTEGKAPVNPHTGLLLDDWPNRQFTPEQILAFNGNVTAVGTRTGPVADHLVILDIDGASAVDKCKEFKCYPKDTGWAIRRDTDPARLKVAFYLPEDLRPLFAKDDGTPIGKKVMRTKPPVYALDSEGAIKSDANGRPVVLQKQEALELFYGTGQCLVLGAHKPSGGVYFWEGSPIQIAEPSANWQALLAEILMAQANEYQRLHPADSGTVEQSGPGNPCRICGRDTTGACTTYTDGGRVRINCFEGQTFSPPQGLTVGETITIDGKSYGFCGHGFNDHIGSFAKFAEHVDRPTEELPPFDQEELDGSSPAELLEVSERLAESRSFFSLKKMLPPDLADALEIIQGPLPTDPLSAAMPLLTGYSGLMKLGTRASSSYGFSKPTNMFYGSVMRTGLAKTSIKNELLDAPAKDVKKSLVRGHELEMEAWKQKNKGKPKDEKSPAPQPSFPHINDYSPASLYRQLAANAEKGLGQLIVRDELSALFGRISADTRSGSGDGEGQLLELYDGDGYTAIRIESAARTFEASHVSLYGNIQPDVLKFLVNDDDSTGKFARFLWGRVPARALVLNDADPTPEEVALIKEAKAKLTSYANKVFALPPRTYKFETEARKRFHAWFREHQNRSLLLGTPKVVAALLGKTSAHALRVAGVMHVIKVAGGAADINDDISFQTVDVAMAIVDQLMKETEAFHEEDSSPDGTSAIDLMRHIHDLSWNTKKAVSRQDCRDKGGRPVRRELKAPVFKSLLDELVRLKYGTSEDVKKGNGKATLFYQAKREMPL